MKNVDPLLTGYGKAPIERAADWIGMLTGAANPTSYQRNQVTSKNRIFGMNYYKSKDVVVTYHSVSNEPAHCWGSTSVASARYRPACTGSGCESTGQAVAPCPQRRNIITSDIDDNVTIGAGPWRLSLTAHQAGSGQHA